MNQELLFERVNYKGKEQILKSHSTAGKVQYFFRRIATNGNELSRSSQVYDSLSDCIKGFKADSINAQSWAGEVITKRSINEYQKKK